MTPEAKMRVLYEKTFLQDNKKINDKKIKVKIEDIIENIKNTKNIRDIQNIKKLEGYNDYYRLGVKHIDSEVTLIRCLHKKDIYKYFP